MFNSREEAERYFQQGMTALNQQQFDDALDAFNRTIDLAPQYPEPWMFRGAVKINHLDDLHGGIADCDEALRYLPNHPMAHANRGIARFKLEQYEQAANDFAIVLLSMPLDGNMHRLKGYCHYKLEQYEKGVTHYSAAIRFWHEQSLCYDMRGICYFCLHDFDHALADFNESIRMNPDRPSAYTNRGIVYTRRGDYDLALSDHNKALSYQRESWYLSNRGLVYLMQGNIEKAESDCLAALELDAKAADAYGLRGQIYFLRGDYAAALKDFESMENCKAPGDGHALAAQSIVYYVLGEQNKAINLWHLLARQNPGYRDIQWLQDEFILAQPLMREVLQIVGSLRE